MASGDYARIRHGFWTDPDVRRLDAEQKVLLLYYFSSPHSNMVGLYHCPTFYAALETGVSEEKVVAALADQLKPFVVYDPRTAEVWVKKAARHQVANVLSKDDKRRKKVVGMVGETHSAWLLAQFLTAYTDWQLGIPIPAGVEPPPNLSTDAEGACEAPSKGLVHSIAYHSSAEDKSSGAEPHDESTAELQELGETVERGLGEYTKPEFMALAAPLIREHLQPPDRDAANTDCNIAWTWANGRWKPEDVLDFIRMARILAPDIDGYLSLRLWNGRNNTDRLHEDMSRVIRVTAANRKPPSGRNVGQVLDEIIRRGKERGDEPSVN